MGAQQSCNVLLHVHMDGAIRPETLLDLIKGKQHLECYRPGMTLDDVHDLLRVHDDSLRAFLTPFLTIIIPCLKDDLAAIRRLACEVTEDCFRQNVVYCEVRFAPHVFVTESPRMWARSDANAANGGGDGQVVTVRDVVQAAILGLNDGMERYSVKMRLIVCGLRGEDEHFPDLVEIAHEFRDQGVVGIDMAGNEFDADGKEIPIGPGTVEAYKRAGELGLGRTVHAGENGSAASVAQGINDLHVTRIGHGYHVLCDESVYELVRKERIHLELCIRSSVMTGSVTPDLTQHPAIRFNKDAVNYSLSTDDPTLTKTTIWDEFTMATTKLGFTWEDIARANLNAAQNAFLPDDEKEELVDRVKKAYNIS